MAKKQLQKIMPIERGEWSASFNGGAGYDVLDYVTIGLVKYCSLHAENTTNPAEDTEGQHWIKSIDGSEIGEALEGAAQSANDAAQAANDAAQTANDAAGAANEAAQTANTVLENVYTKSEVDGLLSTAGSLKAQDTNNTTEYDDDTILAIIK